MALLIECMLKCAPILIDNADIVREAMLRQQRELVPKPRVEQKKECGVDGLRTGFIDLRAKQRLRCSCYFAQRSEARPNFF